MGFSDVHPFYLGNIADGDLIDRIFTEHPEIAVTIHCAGLVDATESLSDPLAYYGANLSSGIQLVGHIMRNRCFRIVFGSSAAVYGHGDRPAVEEEAPSPATPYGHSKAMFERILEDITSAGPLRALILRYFNPIGAEPELRAGKRDNIPTHLLSRLIACRVDDKEFVIMGGNWPTRDGSAIRDFVHVGDLADAHVAAVTALLNPDQTLDACTVLNVGSGIGTTILEFVREFELASGDHIRLHVGGRRQGDTRGRVANIERIGQVLEWRTRRTIAMAISDALLWHAKNELATGLPGG